MKKALLTTLLAGGLMGAENAPFIGVSVGNVELKSQVQLVNYESKVDDTHYTATLGQYIDEYGRVSLSYTYVKPTHNIQHSDGASLAFDLILPMIDNAFFVYAGPVAGYTRYEEEAAGIKLDLSGLHYGAQAGAIVRIMNNIEVEGGYRYLIETGSDTLLGVKVEADRLKMWYIGANLRF
ncbi:outer membrane beta-barrel protein [Sulfuricurvum sp.]|uniref:outer membrane beta-barrel protein n=1 Tax=Sulfuricurvum sp. TaxID=2025608 RepID=UPI002E321696|nr:outer membrane beta-barrel protein [Sulfuricurvum sp.]HEX5329219.1 outer membrane beta-barrel protein [Sulfuricurvum sp.]